MRSNLEAVSDFNADYGFLRFSFDFIGKFYFFANVSKRARNCLNFISELFESYFRVDFLYYLAGNSGLFPKDNKEKMPKIDSKKPKPASH